MWCLLSHVVCSFRTSSHKSVDEKGKTSLQVFVKSRADLVGPGPNLSLCQSSAGCCSASHVTQKSFMFVLNTLRGMSVYHKFGFYWKHLSTAAKVT